ncbi:PTS sugar transporter subunit IIA [Brevibacillus fulvus]|uniref:PTS system galactitol-specific IIA component n=1 Tax=Brevibacillus fulvus TaxID=1125967 RepID=A0A939BT80_9BACL|nr:PTS sugar transporter subunit IIA [Brevibacillus fulvus]MBM7589204.1 PTS system galactitol-specific IIA component [Brevibacillus fulvus]
MLQEFFIPKLTAASNEEVIGILGQKLLNAGYVAATFIDAVLQRERTLPTGLQTGAVNVAIPHTDATHVVKSTIALATLAQPVNFRLMVDPATEIGVQLVFLLAVRDPREQVELLKKLTAIFQDEALLRQMLETADSQGIYQLMSAALAVKNG